MVETEESKDDRTKKSDRFWILVGKVGAILGLILAGDSVRNVFTTPKGRLVGKVQHAPFGMPPTSGRYEVLIRAAQAKAKEELVAQKVKPTGEILKNLMSDPDFLVKEVRSQVTSARGMTEGILYVKVSNEGDSSLKDVRLIVGQSFSSGTVKRAGHEPEIIMAPWEKKMAASDVGLNLAADDLINEIKLGDMAPSSEAEVMVFLWSQEPMLFSPIRLIHESGMGKVYMPSYSYPPGEWLKMKWNATPGIFVFWILALVGALFLGGSIVYLVVRRQQRAKM